ncbi:IS1096 element passenger TnpR family protein [Cupriavidus basilensis]|uniref:IS1096 element passenger TnpR family protein n=1 Tax=Cupriavidus basilensis TaxID=68895 RepID=UPI0023E7CFDE|nr:hypothetical protein [Cupriavidus basilensis]MDF3887674.1 hypothetical protein [Cupriavidus basilensis]
MLIPEHITPKQLHDVIQAVMGWTDEHLHQFLIGGQGHGEAREGALQFSTMATALTLGAFALREYEGIVLPATKYFAEFLAYCPTLKRR